MFDIVIEDKLEKLYYRLWNVDSWNNSASSLFKIDKNGYILSFIVSEGLDFYLSKYDRDVLFDMYLKNEDITISYLRSLLYNVY